MFGLRRPSESSQRSGLRAFESGYTSSLWCILAADTCSRSFKGHTKIIQRITTLTANRCPLGNDVFNFPFGL
jgi:hypothetical protein